MEGRKTTMPKTVSKNQKIVLQAMMPKGFLRNQDVITLFSGKSKTYCYELLNQIERKGFVRKKTQCIHDNDHQYTTHYFELTDIGMLYLMACSDMPALKAAKDLYTDAVLPCAAMKTKQRARQFRIKEIEQFCSGCRVLVSTDPRPAESSNIYGSRERESAKITSVENLYEQGLIAFRKNFLLPDTSFAFYSAAEIKPLNISAEQESRHESSVISSTYLGAILNARRGLIVYRPRKGMGMGWNQKVERAVRDRVMTFACQHLKHCNSILFYKAVSGLILVSDAKEAAAVITGKEVKEFHPERAFSSPFDVYLLTNDAFGRQQLRFLLEHPDPEQELTARLASIKGLDTQCGTLLFPAKYQDTPCFLGILPDAHWLCKLYTDYKPNQYYVICERSQTEFYRTVLPDVRQLVLNSSLLDSD